MNSAITQFDISKIIFYVAMYLYCLYIAPDIEQQYNIVKNEIGQKSEYVLLYLLG